MDHRVEGANLFVLIRDLQAMVEKRCHRFLAQYGLTVPQYRLLLATANGGAATLGELADGINCTRGNLTGVTDRLERDGWLARERDRDDRRVITLKLTSKGECIQTIHAELMTSLAGLVNTWTPEERTVLASLLGRFTANSTLFAEVG